MFDMETVSVLFMLTRSQTDEESLTEHLQCFQTCWYNCSVPHASAFSRRHATLCLDCCVIFVKSYTVVMWSWSELQTHYLCSKTLTRLNLTSSCSSVCVQIFLKCKKKKGPWKCSVEFGLICTRNTFNIKLWTNRKQPRLGFISVFPTMVKATHSPLLGSGYWVEQPVFTCRSSITTGQFYRFRKKAAAGITTGQANSPHLIDLLISGTALVPQKLMMVPLASATLCVWR